MPLELNAQDRFGKCALHYACDRGRAMITFLLVAENSNLDLLDQDGKPPIYYARLNNHSITEQVASSAKQQLSQGHVQQDIRMFLESFGYVERVDFIDDLQKITRHMSSTLNIVTDELATSDTDFTDLTDYGTDTETARPARKKKIQDE